MNKTLSVLVCAGFLAISSSPAYAQDFTRILQNRQLAVFILFAGLLISLSIWAILDRQNIVRRFRKLVLAKTIEDQLLDFAPAGYLILRQGGHCYCSDRLREWLGFTQPVIHIGELAGGKDKPGLDHESFSKLKSYVLQIAKRRIPFPLRVSHALKDEDLYFFGKTLKTQDGAEPCILLWVTLGEEASPKAAGKGISPQSIDAAQSQESFELYLEAQADTLNGLSTSVAIFGPDQAMRFANQAFRALWSLPEDWVEAVPDHGEFLDRMREERRLPEQADFASWKKKILSYYAELRDPVEEMWHLPDGRTLRVVTQPYLLGGLIVFFEDVTDRLDLERSYNTLIAVQKETLDHLHEAVTVIGSDGRLQLYNPHFMRTWNLQDKDLKNNPHISDVLDLWRPMLDKGDDTWKETKNQVLGHIINRDQLSGRWSLVDGKTLQHIIVPLPDGATLLTMTDVTDSAHVENALRDKNRALETADKLKSEFVTGISDDLRLPLSSIISFSEILDKEYFGELNDKQKNYLSWIMKASNQVKSFIDDVMDLAVIEAGEMRLQTAEFDVGKTVKQVVDEFKSQSHQKHFSLDLNTETTTGAANGDERRFRHAILNILEDAIERIPAGGKIVLATKGDQDTVEVSLAYRNAEIPLFLRDEMPGEKPKKKAKNTDRDFIGLRLSLARSIVKLHGGHVEYDLVPDKDSTIRCTIARNISAPEAKDETPSA